ncbi:hypothetical protein HAZT_HAZT011209 [Hyalella azteca]|uniref:LIM zinc-binding domain-containing protein n=1 Tax=Hyalella azteca TaxID=294128 RepID=A0A6A0GZN8_HYAAZ|nr:hypothetical protein HAZT_HAZT011209 [Hyalella azteca]
MLQQQIPLYDMDETHRCETMPSEELAQFKSHLEHIRTHVVGQGQVSEVHLAPKLLVGSLGRSSKAASFSPHEPEGENNTNQWGESNASYYGQKDPSLPDSRGNLPGGPNEVYGTQGRYGTPGYLQGTSEVVHGIHNTPKFNVRDNSVFTNDRGASGSDATHSNSSERTSRVPGIQDAPLPPYPWESKLGTSLAQTINEGEQQPGHFSDSRNNNYQTPNNRSSFMGDMLSQKLGDLSLQYSDSLAPRLHSADPNHATQGATYPHPAFAREASAKKLEVARPSLFLASSQVRANDSPEFSQLLVHRKDYGKPIADHRTGKPVVNPATGKPIVVGQQIIDPITNEPIIDCGKGIPIIMGQTVIDTNNGKPVLDPATGQPLKLGQPIYDPRSGKPIVDPSNSRSIILGQLIVDPITHKPIIDIATSQPYVMGQPILNPSTRTPITDPVYEQCYVMGQFSNNPANGLPIMNPLTAQPILMGQPIYTPAGEPLVYPSTGQLPIMGEPILDSTGHLVINPATNEPYLMGQPLVHPLTRQVLTDPLTHQPYYIGQPIVDPATGHMIINPESGEHHIMGPLVSDPAMGYQIMDPSTGKPIIDPNSGKPIPAGAIIAGLAASNRNNNAAGGSLQRPTEHGQQHLPYPAYRERLAGSSQLPTSEEVSVLLPHESNVLKGRQVVPDVGAGTHPSSPYNCQHCHEPMIPGDVAVICERAGPQKFWHPRCFVCHECGELLADMIYFWHGDHIYCGRHYHKVAEVPRCHGCDELIFSNSWTRADGHDWHLTHFTCFLCDKPLAGESYVPSDSGHPYCIPCHMIARAQIYSSFVSNMGFTVQTCETCELKIEPGSKQCQFRGYHFHASDECFCCHNCRKPLLGGKFKLVKNWMFCSQPCVDTCKLEIEKNPSTKFKHGETEEK